MRFLHEHPGSVAGKQIKHRGLVVPVETWKEGAAEGKCADPLDIGLPDHSVVFLAFDPMTRVDHHAGWMIEQPLKTANIARQRFLHVGEMRFRFL